MASVSRLVASLSAAALCAAPHLAHAQVATTPASPAATATTGSEASMLPEIDMAALAPLVEQFAAENVRRLRRGIAFGPRLGVAGLERTRPEASFDAQFTLGLSLYTFKVPLTYEVQGVIVERVRARLLSRVRQLVDSGKTPSRDDILSEGRNIFEQVADEVLGRHERQDRTLEKPRFTLSLDGGYQPRVGSGFVRFTPSIGVWHFNLGLPITTVFNDRSTLMVGLEAGLPITPAAGPRPTVYEPFVRVEAGLFHRGEYGVQTTVGFRMLLDLI